MARLVRTYMLLPALLMLVIVFYPFAANLFYTNTEIMDNRPLHEKPVKFTRNYAREFEDYYNDTFAGRKKIISKYVKLQKKLKIDAGQYFYGQDGWIFYDSIKANNGNTLVDYYAEVYFDDEELEKMAQGINMAYDFYAKRGIKYVIFVAPNKENIYSEFMPERMQRIRKSDVSRMDKAVEYLKKHTRAEIVNAKPAMVKAKSVVAQNLYFKKDTHWNNVGGYVGFEQLAAALQPYLNRSFGTVFYSTAGLKKLSEIEKIVDETKPDLVVDELVERYFSRFANYPRIFGGEYD